jgi:hypothetical protein
VLDEVGCATSAALPAAPRGVRAGAAPVAATTAHAAEAAAADDASGQELMRRLAALRAA